MKKRLIIGLSFVAIIAFAAVLLPYLKVGGMQIFQTEASGYAEKVMPRSVEIVLSLLNKD